MSFHVPLIEYLCSRQGTYVGHGTNADSMSFTARLEIKSRVGDHLIELAFRAEDAETAFHEEVTWITNDLLADQTALWTVSSNTPGVLKHELAEDRDDELRARRLVFRLGQPDDQRSFRQEITLDFMRDGSVEYRYAWGVPHETFAPRIRTILKPA